MKTAALVLSVFGLVLALFIGAGVLYPSSLIAQSSSGAPGQTTNLSSAFQLPNPLKGNNDLPTFIKKVLEGLVQILTPFIVIMLVYTGFLFVSAQGNTEKLGEAKKMLTYTLIGAAIVIGAEGISLIIQNTVGCLAGGTNC